MASDAPDLLAAGRHLRWGAVWLVLAGLTFLPIPRVPPSVLPVAAVAFGGQALRHFVPGLRPGPLSDVAGRIVRGAALATALYRLLGIVPRASLDPLRLPVAAVLLGLVVLLQADEVPRDRRMLRTALRWVGGGILVAAVAVATTSALGPGVVARGLLVVAVGWITALLADHLLPGRAAPDRAALRGLRTVAPMVLGLAAAAVTYVLVGLDLATRLRYLPLIEWLSGLVAVAYLLQRVSRTLEREAVTDPRPSRLARHVQTTEVRLDPRMAALHSDFQGFLEGRIPPDRYAGVWAELLERAGTDAARTAALLADVRAHRDRSRVGFGVPGRSRAAERANRDARRALHDRLLAALADPRGGSSPTEPNP